MANKMLIDASHPEETRVVVLRGNRIEEFDFESASKKPLRGNIYLAKVTRVEPSLQAAFIEYGGNRHGFLAFSEIHPDYYQIPVADRQALLEEELRHHKDEEEEEPRGGQRRNRRSRRRNGRSEKRARNADETISSEPIADTQESAGEQHDGAQAQQDHHAETGADVPANSDVAPPADQTTPALGDAPHEWTPRADAAPAPESAEQATGQESGAQENNAAPANDDARAAEAAADVPSEDARNSQRAEIVPGEPVATSSDDGETVEARTGRAEADASVAHDESEEHDDHHDHDGHDHDDDHDENDDEDEDEDDEEDDDAEEEEEHVEHVGGDDFEEMPARSGRSRRQYKIQEVIRRRQVLLVQVVKEERGNKGAALTTYLSLAGRYSVLMPNTARGGGISRKITDNEDRKRLKEIAQDLEVPEGMGVILRTAGASRTKQEVRRDFEYLLRMWESVRELTLESTAPTLVYEEGSLIKRSIRDLYGKEIDEVTVAGENGFREARDYMRMLMPSHVKNVKPWRETQPLFARMGVEAQLDAMFSSQVTLKSGGYIVINQTEALVAIDVNSGRSTREHNIEDTALRTNLEAADEVARQLRLRDLAGLIVVDFIDMEENRNNRAVERRLKEALKNDRARIQVGRISHFGLLEMSRQRMRTGVLEGSSVLCPHCNGAGTVRSTASISLHILRVIEDTLIRNAQYNLTVRTRTNVALYILNQKRAHLAEIEARFGVTLTIEADDTLTGTVYHALERGDLASAPPAAPKQGLVRLDSIAPLPEAQDEDEPEEAENDNEDEDEDAEAENGGASAEGQNGENGRKRRRRRRRRGRDRDPSGIDPDAPQPSDEALAAMAQLGGDLPSGDASGHDIPALDLPRANDAEVDEAEAEKEGEEALAGGQGDGRRRRRPRRPRRDRGDHASEPGFRSPYGTWVRSEEEAAPDFGAQPEVVDLSQAERPPMQWSEGREDQPPLSATEPVQPEPESARVATPEPASTEQPSRDEQPAPVAAQPEAEAASPAESSVAEAPAEPQPEPTKAEQPKAAPREPEPLPEAPAPAEKRRGWWQRAKAQITGE